MYACMHACMYVCVCAHTNTHNTQTHTHSKNLAFMKIKSLFPPNKNTLQERQSTTTHPLLEISMSVLHMPACRTLTSASPGPGIGIGTSSIRTIPSVPSRAARIVVLAGAFLGFVLSETAEFVSMIVCSDVSMVFKRIYVYISKDQLGTKHERGLLMSREHFVRHFILQWNRWGPPGRSPLSKDLGGKRGSPGKTWLFWSNLKLRTLAQGISYPLHRVLPSD